MKKFQVLSYGLSFVGESRSFKAVDSDPALVKTLDAQCPVSSIIELKLGAQVGRTHNNVVLPGFRSSLWAGNGI